MYSSLNVCIRLYFAHFDICHILIYTETAFLFPEVFHHDRYFIKARVKKVFHSQFINSFGRGIHIQLRNFSPRFIQDFFHQVLNTVDANVCAIMGNLYNKHMQHLDEENKVL